MVFDKVMNRRGENWANNLGRPAHSGQELLDTFKFELKSTSADNTKTNGTSNPDVFDSAIRIRLHSVKTRLGDM